MSPDAGRVRVAERWTDVLGAPLAIIHKRRDPDVPNQVRVFEVVGDVRDRVCVLVDDMIDTGGTIVKAAETLFENGAADVIVAATHGILSDPARERLQESRISEVIVTNTLPIPDDRRFAEAHGPVDRPDPGQGHHRGLHRRLGDQHVRRRRAGVRGLLPLGGRERSPGRGGRLWQSSARVRSRVTDRDPRSSP